MRAAAEASGAPATAILRPPVGSPMPEDFGERMTEDELAALVDFLLAVREPQ